MTVDWSRYMPTHSRARSHRCCPSPPTTVSCRTEKRVSHFSSRARALEASRAHLERFLAHQGVDTSSLTWALDQTLPEFDFGAKRRRIVRREASL